MKRSDQCSSNGKRHTASFVCEVINFVWKTGMLAINVLFGVMSVSHTLLCILSQCLTKVLI